MVANKEIRSCGRGCKNVLKEVTGMMQTKHIDWYTQLLS